MVQAEMNTCEEMGSPEETMETRIRVTTYNTYKTTLNTEQHLQYNTYKTTLTPYFHRTALPPCSP